LRNQKTGLFLCPGADGFVWRSQTANTQLEFISVPERSNGFASADVTASTESSVSQTKEIASSRENAETMTQYIEIDFSIYDFRKVWQWGVLMHDRSLLNTCYQ